MSYVFTPLNDEQWEHCSVLFPNEEKRGRGKPHAPWRRIFNSILFILISGSKWSALPVDDMFVTKSVAHRWFVIWEKSTFLQKLLDTYQSVLGVGLHIKLPRRRKRLPKISGSLGIDAQVAS